MSKGDLEQLESDRAEQRILDKEDIRNRSNTYEGRLSLLLDELMEARESHINPEKTELLIAICNLAQSHWSYINPSNSPASHTPPPKSEQ